MKNSTFWICAVIFIVFAAHWVVHKFRQLKYKIKELETEISFYIQIYGKQRQEEREKETGKEGQAEQKEG